MEKGAPSFSVFMVASPTLGTVPNTRGLLETTVWNTQAPWYLLLPRSHAWSSPQQASQSDRKTPPSGNLHSPAPTRPKPFSGKPSLRPANGEWSRGHQGTSELNWTVSPPHTASHLAEAPESPYLTGEPGLQPGTKACLLTQPFSLWKAITGARVACGSLPWARGGRQ